MRNFTRIASGVNVTPLVLAINRRPDLWTADTFMRKYPQGPFGEIDTIFLRFPKLLVAKDEAEIELYKANRLPGHDQHESIDFPAYSALHEARTLVMNVFAAVGGVRLGRVLINRIAPGGQIFKHADTPEHCRVYSRFHVVLQGTPETAFECGDEVSNWEDGAVFWFNNKLEHAVHNRSSRLDRIHLIIDAQCSGDALPSDVDETAAGVVAKISEDSKKSPRRARAKP